MRPADQLQQREATCYLWPQTSGLSPGNKKQAQADHHASVHAHSGSLTQGQEPDNPSQGHHLEQAQ